ncbi:hypothetical protein [Nocardioides gilvus]|uniref:hypothetical protein n=1 Tax=Nocardioides gilvus TaxID=1735589 RepID=UPI000D74AAE2|nr:hypothetical protein [Nocardioides gilvus]
MTIFLLVVVIASLVTMVFVLSRGQATSTRRIEAARERVRIATDLAYSHDEISPALAGAIIARTRGLREDSSVHSLEDAIDDVLTLARQHRETEPDLAVIVIDSVRREGPPERLG